MVKLLATLALGALLSGCTLLIEGAIATPDGGGGGGLPDGGPCLDLPFDDGFTDGGVRFKSGVTTLWGRGPSGPASQHPRPEFYGATIAFAQSGVLFVGGGNDRGPSLFGGVGSAPDAVSIASFHDLQNGTCAYVLAGSFDSRQNRTSWMLYGPGCANDFTLDAGVITGPPQGAVGWFQQTDGGGLFGQVLGSQQISCPEKAFPPSCAGASDAGTASTLAGDLQLEGLLPGVGDPTWALFAPASGGSGEVKFYSGDLQTEVTGQAPLAGLPALVQPSVGVAARLAGGQLRVASFDVLAPTGNVHTLQLNDSSAHSLSIAGFEPGYALASWVGGDGRARVTEFSTVTGVGGFSDVFTLCGPGGVKSAFAINGNQLVVLEGDSLAVRPFR